MKDWFPFTEYDFYAYITAGAILIAAIDYTLANGNLVSRADWSIVQAIFWTMISYLVGHVTAGFSSFFMEQLLLKRVFINPIIVILGIKEPRYFELLFKHLFATEYSPFPESVCQKIRTKLRTSIGDIKDPENIFQTAFAVARYESSSEARLNQFMNLYGLCRNVSFVALVSTALLWIKTYQSPNNQDAYLAWASIALAVGMFGRFIKFYSSYTREVLRAFERASA